MRPDRQKHGFSLIEIIAAMSVLAIIMVLISQAYTSVNGSWRDGMVSSDQNSGGRSALAFMARELSQAVVSQKFQMVVKAENDTSPYGGNDSAIWFTALDGRPRKPASGDRRQVQDISYFVETNDKDSDLLVDFEYRKLQRIGNSKTAKLQSTLGGDISTVISRGGSDFNQGSELLPFVHKFKIALYGVDVTGPDTRPVPLAVPSGGGGPADYYSHGPGGTAGLGGLIPVYADLYLEVLGHDIAQTLATGGLSAAAKAKYAESNLQRFTTRVYFPSTVAYNRMRP